MINLVVTMIVKEGRMKDFLSECEALRPLVLREKGCIAYEYTRDVQSSIPIQEKIDPNRITLIERWESLDALKVHGDAPHMAAAGPRMQELRASVAIRVTEDIF